MHIVISGASGMVGVPLVTDLEEAGHRVIRLVRRSDQVDGDRTVLWDPKNGQIDPSALTGADAVINLSGRSIADGRWTDTAKDELRSSRIESTRLLVKAIGEASPGPRLLINASAVGLYGDRGDEILTERSQPGTGFLADLARDWEEEAGKARHQGVRVVALRLGMVIGRGGALDRMLLPFKLGAGGPIGNGRQWWSWVHIDDVLGVIRWSLATKELDGPLNVVSPNEVRCRDFASTLGRILRRPAFLPLPAFAARLALGEMADALLLASLRVQPDALLSAGYRFEVPDLGDAIRRSIG